jgi:hypothetical protein
MHLHVRELHILDGSIYLDQINKAKSDFLEAFVRHR